MKIHEQEWTLDEYGDVCRWLESLAARTNATLDEMRGMAAAPKMERALLPLARFVQAWDAAPMRGLDDVLYSIHGGRDAPSGKGEEIRLSECIEAQNALRSAGVL